MALYSASDRRALADVTGKNPNVFYELGLAHAAGKPVVVVTNSLEDVPFDLKGLRVIEYDEQNEAWGTILEGEYYGRHESNPR